MSQPAVDPERHLAMYNQNSEHFRGLNSQMWQIPIIGMTLTGGLWFGVSNVKDSPLFQMGLLLLAAAGNIALVLVLYRLRFVMGAYLKWLDDNEPTGKIDADGQRIFEKSFFVRSVFQTVLSFAALISLVLLGATAVKTWKADKRDAKSLVSYYDSYATMLGDENEVPEFAAAHPYLAASLPRGGRLTILHVGSGAIRDARALAAMGHRVLVASPSTRLAHVRMPSVPGSVWKVQALPPELANVRGSRRFDLIILNGVWAHVPDDQRQRLIDRLLDLLRPDGRLYLAFRAGPSDPDRMIFAPSVTEIRRLAAADNVTVTEIDQRPDLAGRSKVTWRTVLVELAKKEP